MSRSIISLSLAAATCAASPVLADPLASVERARASPETVERAPSRIPLATIFVDTSLGDARIASSRVDVRELDDTALVALSFVVSSRVDVWTAAHLKLNIPPGARVVALSTDVGGVRSEAVPAPAGEAQRAFDRAFDRLIDPALLAWAAPNRTHQRFRLSLFPVAADAPAVAVVTIAMPRFDRLVAFAAGVRHERRGARADDATAEDRRLAALPALVVPGGSLYAGPAVDATPPLEAPEIRNQVRLGRHSLARCASRPGSIVLHFTIAPTGEVVRHVISGDAHLAGDACMEQVVRAWRFRPRSGDDPIEVSYPIRFAAR